MNLEDLAVLGFIASLISVIGVPMSRLELPYAAKNLSDPKSMVGAEATLFSVSAAAVTGG